MSDFEDRLGSALRGVAHEAPAAMGLADAARTRSRARRRRTALASTAGIVAVTAVVGGVALLGSNGDGGPTRVATDPPSTEPAATTRVETWHDVSVTVPADWGHGNLDDWCSSGENDGRPVVERPGAVSIDILCTPMYGYGVQFLDETSGVSIEAFSPGTVNRSISDDYPKGSWQGYEQAGGTRVLVVAATQEEAAQVLGSFEHVTGVDANGCAPRAEGVTMAAAGTLQVCRYSVDGRLEQSEVLTGQDASDAIAALDAAPTSPTKPCPTPTTEYVAVTGADVSGQVNLDACGAVNWRDEHRDLTADVLYWVLTPGWAGGVAGDVPMPPQLRQR